MDVSPTLHLDDPFKTDLFDLVNCPDYDLNSVSLDADFGNIDDLVSRSIGANNNNLLPPSWNYNVYPDAVLQSNNNIIHEKEKVESSDKMWGGGSTTEKVVNSATGNTILITFPTTESVAPDTSDNSHIPSPQSCELFPTILTDKPFDVLVSHSHRSPASDCVSYVSAGSGYSDSGISTSLDETASPAGHPDHVDFDRLVDSAVDSMVYSPETGLPTVEESTVLDSGIVHGSYMGSLTYLSSGVSQSSDTSILEGALRGTVRRPVTHHTTHISTQLKTDGKTLTVMDNMTPLPPLTSAFKLESLGLPPSQPQISSTNGIYQTNSYDYLPQPSEEFTTLDSSFNKLSTAATSSTKNDMDSKSRKRKYTKRGSSEEPASKGRLLHFCNICNKGFKDKYSVNVHHRTHTGEKPFTCELCGKCFRQKAHLAKHVQIHTAPKPPGKR